MDEIVDVIRREGETIAVVLLPGVHYFTGQVFDMNRITKVAHEHGCMVSWWKHARSVYAAGICVLIFCLAAGQI